MGQNRESIEIRKEKGKLFVSRKVQDLVNYMFLNCIFQSIYKCYM